MIAIIINSIIMIISLSTMTSIREFCHKYNYVEMARLRFYALGGAVVVSAICNILMVLSYGTLFDYLFYSVDRFARLLFLAEIVLNVEDIIDIPGGVVSKFVSFLVYCSMALYFIDTIINKGILHSSLLGVYAAPGSPFHLILYFIVYACFFVVFFVFIVYKLTSINKKREKNELTLLSLSLGFCAIGFLQELYLFTYLKGIFIPIVIFNFASLLFMFHLLMYHRHIQLRADDYESELDASGKDIIFILDDDLVIKFINKRAEVLSIIVDDTFIGKRIDEVFDFSEENYDEIRFPKEKIPFGSSAIYKHMNKHVNMVFDHRYDVNGELFSSCITLYNMEPKEMLPDSDEDENNAPLDEIEKMYEEAKEMTKGKSVLIIGEDLSFIKDFENSFESYEMVVSSAIGGRAGVEEISEKPYNIVFVIDGMIQYSAYEVAKKVRENNKELPLIFVTDTDINEIFLEMLDSGFTDYISKPIQPLQLNSSLTRWLWNS